MIKTAIYGVKPSGNQAEKALRDAALLSEDEFPRIKEVIYKDLYVDDGISGASDIRKAHVQVDHLGIVVGRAGFSLKGGTFSGQPPSKDLSVDGESINVA